MRCDVAGCETPDVSQEAQMLHWLLASMDEQRKAAWHDLYGNANTPCATHMINGLAYVNQIALDGQPVQFPTQPSRPKPLRKPKK